MDDELHAVVAEARLAPGVVAAEAVEDATGTRGIRIVVAPHADPSAVAASVSGLLLPAVAPPSAAGRGAVNGASAISGPPTGSPTEDWSVLPVVAPQPVAQDSAPPEPAASAPAPSEPAAQKPAPQEPAAQKPAPQEPAPQQPAPQDPPAKEPAPQVRAPQQPALAERVVVPAPRSSRPRLLRSEVSTSGDRLSATVVLGALSGTATGEAEGVLTSTGVQRAVAQATLHALDQLAPDDAQLVLEQVDVRGTSPDGTALVCVVMARGGTAERLVGAAALRGDTNDAVVRATLDACNRRLEGLLR